MLQKSKKVSVNCIQNIQIHANMIKNEMFENILLLTQKRKLCLFKIEVNCN